MSRITTQFDLQQSHVADGRPGIEALPMRQSEMPQRPPFRLAILISHPVQYFAPLFRRLAQQPEIDLTVLYCSLYGARTVSDPGFGMSFAWDIPLLEGYQYKELKNYWRGHLKGFFSYTNPGIIRELRTGGYDAVIIFGWGSLVTWLAFAGARLAGIPWMLYGDTISLYEADYRWPKRELRSRLLRALFHATGAFLISGAFNRKFYEQYGASSDKCFDVPLSVDIELFSRRAEEARPRRNELRAKLGIPLDKVLFLFVGKLVRWKRPQDLLEALKCLRATTPNAAVAFVGEGELRPSLEAQIVRLELNDVHLLGFKNQSELPQMYAIADAFVLPSSSDRKPLVVNEAMACGLPVIVSDRTGVWGPGDIVRGGENGFVYPCGDIDALAKAVRKLAIDPGLRLCMGRRSAEIIRNFGYEKCIEGILEALNSVVRPRHCQPNPGIPAKCSPTVALSPDLRPVSQKSNRPFMRNS